MDRLRDRFGWDGNRYQDNDDIGPFFYLAQKATTTQVTLALSDAASDHLTAAVVDSNLTVEHLNEVILLSDLKRGPRQRTHTDDNPSPVVLHLKPHVYRDLVEEAKHDNRPLAEQHFRVGDHH